MKSKCKCMFFTIFLLKININFINIFRLRGGRSLSKQKTKQIDDDTNDFNEDYSLLDAITKTEGEGNVTQDDDEGRAKGYKGNKKGSYIYGDDHEGFYGYSGGKGN